MIVGIALAILIGARKELKKLHKQLWFLIFSVVSLLCIIALIWDSVHPEPIILDWNPVQNIFYFIIGFFITIFEFIWKPILFLVGLFFFVRIIKFIWYL